jgi:hypothetical protein
MSLFSCRTCSRRLWHDSDFPRCLLSGRYRGQSGRTFPLMETTRLTLNRHRQEYFAAMHSVPVVK